MTSASFRQLCVIAHHVFDRLGDLAGPSDVVAEMKDVCGRAGLVHRLSRDLVKAADAVAVARAKGYGTPIHRGRSVKVGPSRYIAAPTFTREELNRAEHWRRAVGFVTGCPHTPICADWSTCRGRLIRAWRTGRKL